MRPRHFFSLPLGVTATLCLTAGALHAQTTTARLTGTVTDPSGAAVSNATVEITSETTGQVRTVTTNASGLYVAVSLPPSTYDVKITASGFSDNVQRNLVIAVGQELTKDFTLGWPGLRRLLR